MEGLSTTLYETHRRAAKELNDPKTRRKHADGDALSVLKEAVTSHLQRVCDIFVADTNTSANVEGDGNDDAVEQRRVI